MKKKGFFILFFIVIITVFTGSLSASKETFEFKLSGGIGRYQGKDFTLHQAGWNTLIVDQGLNPESLLKFSRQGIDFESQLTFNLSRSLGIGIGVGYFKADEDSQLAWTKSGVKTIIRDRFKADVIPFTALVMLHFPLGSRLRLNVNGAVGYYSCKISWQEDRSTVNDAWDPEKKNILGYQGGISVDIKLVRSFALVIEGFGRYLKLEGLIGIRRFKGQEYPGNRLWLGQEGGVAKWYDKIAIKETQPQTDAGHTGWREAVIDLSTIGVRLGFNIRF